jgi:hypothetical protein
MHHMEHMDHGMMHQSFPRGAAPVEPGQAAFAAIQEIVALLEADPETEWGKVDIDALRRHLVDMDNVTMRAQVTSEPVDGGMRFVVTGDPEVAPSIRRMVTAHATAMTGAGGWAMTAGTRDDGAVLTVTSMRQGDAAKIKALGFFGIMTRGMHHQQHHLMIARGESPHSPVTGSDPGEAPARSSP